MLIGTSFLGSVGSFWFSTGKYFAKNTAKPKVTIKRESAARDEKLPEIKSTKIISRFEKINMSAQVFILSFPGAPIFRKYPHEETANPQDKDAIISEIFHIMPGLKKKGIDVAMQIRLLNIIILFAVFMPRAINPLNKSPTT